VSRVLVAGSLDDLQARDVRFLQEAARWGPVHVLLWSDDAVEALEGRPPKYPQAERRYLVEAIRYVDRVTLVDGPVQRDALPPEHAGGPGIWAVDEPGDSPTRWAFCHAHGVDYHVIAEDALGGFPEPAPEDSSPTPPGSKKVIVTGCYDWFHSGHVRFFEEVSELGDLYVVVGHDDNIRLLKGPGHPLFPQAQRRYMAGSIRYVKQALVSTGHGWLDAEPEIVRIRPDIYAVNEDGDKPEKRDYCHSRGIDYRVLRRLPKEGLPRRESTHLRGF